MYGIYSKNYETRSKNHFHFNQQQNTKKKLYINKSILYFVISAAKIYIMIERRYKQKKNYVTKLFLSSYLTLLFVVFIYFLHKHVQMFIDHSGTMCVYTFIHI